MPPVVDPDRETTTPRHRPTARQQVVLPAELRRRIADDPLFHITTLDRTQWIEPFTGQAIPAKGDLVRTAEDHYVSHQVWVERRPLPRERVMELRWRYDLLRLLPREGRLRIFAPADGPWLNPYTGNLVEEVRKTDGHITTQTVRAMAKVLATCPEADRGILLDKAILKERASQAGPFPTHGESDRAEPALPMELSRDMERAGAVQKHMLANLPTIPGFAFAVHYAPHSGVSGDFYEVLPLGEDRFLVLLGDVSGHGMQAALLVASAVRTVRMIGRSSRDLVEILTRFNEELRQDLLPGQFITLSASVLQPSTRRLEVVLAGHHPMLIANLDHATPLRKVGRPGMAIGLVGDSARFAASLRPETIDLVAGDVAVQYSDGIEEAQDVNGQEFGRARIFAHLVAGCEGSLVELVDGLASTVASHAGGKAGDDVTLFAIRVSDLEDAGETLGSDHETALNNAI